MTGPEWLVRVGRTADRDLLATFACADPSRPWETEVEDFATKIEVIAIAGSWQGRRFGSGERVSDVLMSAVMSDVTARVPPRDARVFAIVHENNHRSLALLRRHGLVEEMHRPHPQYRRPITAHRSGRA